MKATKSLLASAIILSSMGAMAATNPGAATAGSSTGDLEVLLQKGDAVRISGLDDVDFGITNVNPVNQVDTACVYTTSTNYDILATSEHGIGGVQGFRMGDAGDANFIRYDVQWDDLSANTENLTEGTTSATVFVGDNADELCSGGTNVTITINPNNGDFTAAPTGAYDDPLTLLVTAQ
jgi:hypothetical protein